ncbi:N-acetylmuramoyl-L-alanine amidase family protein [Granulicella tundricola]|uniref:N-acetylmuramoyl-L-alanine amidase n=1 Tax=Granulicella tundricola (strain ATCC BAA-1859 / DSM 23138 / MP5ACTX9) TaxID=1198114 RepID=E8X597_GRATM|nr:N-acetylmuramoyl-L-alanine amidase [Granulicella tundricola]ADW68361.1 cell wall hydrolase/autolysin [Granulicella tundricola MP5ACTX9]
MIPFRIAVLLLAASSVQASAQTDAPAATPTPKPHKRAAKPYQPSFNPTLILLDPAHGNQDSGATLGPNLKEKDLNLAFAQRLRGLLQAKGFTVQLTREADAPAPAAAPPADPDNPTPPPPPPPQLTPDQRAEQANRLHPGACLLIHTTPAGHGVHLFLSALTAPNTQAEPRQVLLWDTAQAPALAHSTTLSGRLAETLTAQSIPLVTGRVSVKPIDSMSCPAVTLEIAPLAEKGGKTTPVQDQAYQQKVAAAIAEGLGNWRTDAEAILQAEAAEAARAAAALNPAKPEPAKPAAKPKPAKPVVTPGHLIPGQIAPLPKIPQIVAPTTKRPAAPAPGVPQ